MKRLIGLSGMAQDVLKVHGAARASLDANVRCVLGHDFGRGAEVGLDVLLLGVRAKAGSAVPPDSPRLEAYFRPPP